MTGRRLLLLLFFFPAAIAAQTGSIVGVVVAKTSGEPLPYAIVGVDSLDRTAFANDSGRFGVRDLSVGPHVIHFRRLGFTPLDLKVTVREGMTDTLRVELDRVAVALGRITVKAWPACTTPGHPTDSALATIVQQIRLNAEQYKFLAKAYPFWYDITVSRSEKLRKNGLVIGSPAAKQRIQSRAARAYKPGDVIYPRGASWFFQVPTLQEVADKKFVDSHCWHYGGVETIEDEEMYRVDIVADDRLMGVDVNGSFFVNKANFQIRRSILHLSRRPRQFIELLDMQTTTDFFEVMPSISIPSHVFATQTIDPERKSEISEAYEEHRTLNFKFVGRRPGESKP